MRSLKTDCVWGGFDSITSQSSVFILCCQGFLIVEVALWIYRWCLSPGTQSVEIQKCQLLRLHLIASPVEFYFLFLVFFRDITTMKGTIVAQVDSSESFQEFCSTSCLSLYEDKQNPTKGALNKSRCTICGKLTEVCILCFIT